MNTLRKLAVVVVALGSVPVAQADPIITIEFEVTTIFTPFQQLEDGAIVQVNFNPADVYGFPYTRADGVWGLGAPILTFSLDGNLVTGEGPAVLTVFNDILDPTFGLIDKVVLYGSDAEEEIELVLSGRASILDDLSFPSLEQLFSFEFGTVSRNDNPAYSGIFNPQTGKVVTVPEPGTLALFAIGLAGMGLARRRKKV